MSDVHDAERLKELQALPLNRKIQITQTRIIEWYQHYQGNVCIAFSGGKDSTVLLHIARQIYPDIKAVFSNTGLEYPEIREFVNGFDGIDIVTPGTNFGQVISQYGYPLIGKEVAEAIHYARQIHSQNVHVERERERENHKAQAHRTGRKEADFRRNQLQGRISKAGVVDSEIRTGGIFSKDNLIQTSTARSRRTVLQGKWGGETQDSEERSLFNKEKYLPLARDVPVMISHYCCYKMKKAPMQKYQRKNGYKPILATLAEESRIRKQAWIRHGCNAFQSKKPTSQPMSFWTEQDVLAYIVEYDVPLASVYGDIVMVDGDGNEYQPSSLIGETMNLKCTGCDRTGCVFCAFGAHLEKGQTRFQRLAVTHPRLYEFCIGGGEWVDNPHYDPTAPKMDGEWQNWNPKKIWTRNGKGLGMGKVFDMVNEIYGKDFYRYD